MSWAGKPEERVRLKVRRYEVDQLMKEKRSEEMEALEEVFDKSTLMVIYRMLNVGDLKKIFGVVRAGKEARIYWGIGRRRRDLAVKVYLTSSAEFRKGMLTYIEGDPRFRRTKRDTRSLIYLWAQKEFKNLQQAHEVGVAVPEPIAVEKNVLLMEFIGREGIPAPLLREAEIAHPGRLYRRLIEEARLLYQEASLVHGDLSEYNVMVWRGRPVIFDISQAVSVEHPMADVFLKRDISNLNRYFTGLGVEVKPDRELHDWVVGEDGG